MLDLKKLYYFVSVAESLNFSRAAERIFVSQSSLSQRIQELERDLGVQLFVRSNRSLALTPAGADLLQRARKLLLSADDLENYFKEGLFTTQSSESLRLGIQKNYVDMPSLLDAVTSAVVCTGEDNRNAKILYEFVDPEDCCGALSDELVDLMICDRVAPDDPKFEHLSLTLILSLSFCLTARKRPEEENRMSWSDVERTVQSLPFLQVENEFPPDRHIEALQSCGLSPRCHRLPTPVFSLTYAMSGQGYVILPMNHFLLAGPNIKFYPLEDRWNVYAVTREAREDGQNSLVGTYIDHLRTQIQLTWHPDRLPFDPTHLP